MEAIAFIGAIVVFLTGLIQYRRAQQWKRAEWIAQEFKMILADPLVDAALKMTDWGGRTVRLFPDARDPDAQFCRVESEEVTAALRSHKAGSAFTEKEAAIRDAFDRLLTGWELVANYVETKLAALEDVLPYMEYWGCHLRSDSEQKRLAQIRSFMGEYGYRKAERLLDNVHDHYLGESTAT